MNDYKPNSNKYKKEQRELAAERERQTKIIKGTAQIKKKNKLADIFIAEDIPSVGRRLFTDVIVPSLQDLVCDVLKSGIEGVFGRRGGGRTSRADKVSYVRYDRYSSDRRDDRRYDDNVNRTRSGYSYDDIKLTSRAEAEEVLIRMKELIEEYGMASVLDLYDLVGVDSTHTDNKYGWINLRNAEVVPVRGGYLLKMPKALPID